MRFLSFLLGLALSVSSCLQVITPKEHDQQLQEEDKELQDAQGAAFVAPHETSDTSADKYFPFVVYDVDDTYYISAHIESEELFPKYYDFFKKHGYEGNGYCWEGHITQILEKTGKGLLYHIEFDPEAGAFYAIADTKENQLKFVRLLAPIFSDLGKLDEWVKKADRSRIDD